MTAQSKHGQVLEAVRDRIATLGLQGILPVNIKMMLLPLVDRALKEGEVMLPAVIVSPTIAETINTGGFTGTNLDDDYGYPVTVAIVEDAKATSLYDGLDKYLYVREQLIKGLHNLRLSDVSSVAKCDVQPASVVELNAWVEKSLFVSGFVVRAISRERRPSL